MFYTDEQKKYFETLQKATSEIFKSFTGQSHEKCSDQYQKNADVLAEVAKIATETLQNLSQLQINYMRQTFEEIQHAIKNCSYKQGGQNCSHVSQKFKDSTYRAMDHGTEVTKIIVKSNEQIFKALNDAIEAASHCKTEHQN